MIFVDSNVPMYLVGAPHANRNLAAECLRTLSDQVFVTSAEVYQECVHRFVAIDRREAIRDCFRLLDGIVDEVYPIERADVVEAARIAALQHGLSGRDSLHLAVIERRGIRQVFTFDKGFDAWPGVRRIPA